MKVVIIAPYFYPHKGGLEQFCFEISTRLVKEGFEITVLTSNIPKSKKQEKIFGIDIIRVEHLNLINGRWPMPKESVTKILNKVMPSLIITNTRFFPLCYSAYKFAKKNNIKLIHIEHGTSVSKLGNFISNSFAAIYDKLYGNKIVRNADKVIGISDAAREFSKTLGAKNPITIYNCVDTDFFKPVKKTKKTKTSITFTGRLIEAKGIQDLIEAFKKINDNDLILNIVGTGFYENELKFMAKNDKRIKFLGEKDQKGIKEVLSQTDIFINPSYGEGLPTSVLEAGSMGIPTIATDVGGTKEIITDGENGFLVPIKKPGIIKTRLVKLIKNDILKKDFSKNIRDKIEHDFSWKTNIKKLKQEIDTI